MNNPDTIMPFGQRRSGFFVRRRSIRDAQITETVTFLSAQ